MRAYDELRDAMDRDRWHLDQVLGLDDSFPLLTRGERFVPTAPLFTEVHSDGPELEFTLSTFGVPIASRRLAEAMARVDSDGLQLVDVDVRGRGPRTILNVVRVVDCFDESGSDFRRWSAEHGRPDRIGEYREVNRLALDAVRIPAGAHIFRVARYRRPIIVSDRMRQTMLAAGSDGAEFATIGLTPAQASG